MFEYAEIYTRRDGKYDFRIYAMENHEILCSSSQGYEYKRDALHSIHRVTGRQVVIVSNDELLKQTKSRQERGYIEVVMNYDAV